MYNDDPNYDPRNDSGDGGTPQQDPFGGDLNALYQQYYQRDADQNEQNIHRGNTGGLDAVETMLRDSIPAPPKPDAPPGPAVPPAPPPPGGGGGGGSAPPRPQQSPYPQFQMPDFSSLFAGQAAEQAAAAAARAEQQKKADVLFEHLMGKAKQSTKIDPNDPVIRAQSDTYSANLTRQGRRYMSELAERKGPGGNISAESRMMAEKNSQAGAAHEGQLFQHELDSRRQEIQHALTQGAQFLTSQQQMALQKELSTIEQNMKLFQTQLQESQFGRNLDFQNRGLAQQGDLARAQMGQAGGQFSASMSAREREFAQNLSQRAYEYDTDDEYRRQS